MSGGDIKNMGACLIYIMLISMQMNIHEKIYYDAAIYGMDEHHRGDERIQTYQHSICEQ